MNATVATPLLKVTAIRAVRSATPRNANTAIRRITGDITAMSKNGNVNLRVTDGDVVLSRVRA